MKKYLRNMILILIALGLTIPQMAEAKKSMTYKDVKIPVIDWTPPDYDEFELKNGISGLVVEDKEVPLVNFRIAFPAMPDPVDKIGLAEMTTYVLRNGGSTNIPADSLNDLIEFKASWIGVTAGQEMLYIYSNCLKDDLPFMLSMVQELINHPAYPEDQIELKRSTMLESIRRDNDSPNWIARREFSRLMYPDHPWGREISEETVKGLTREDILDYHETVFRANGVVIGFSGDVDKKTAQKLSQQYLGGLNRGEGDLANLPAAPEQAKAGVYYAYKDVPQAFLAVGHQTIKYNDPNRHASELMNFILGGGSFSSILTKAIRVNSGLAYSVWSSYSTPVPVEGTFRMSASTKLDQADRTLSMMKDVLTKYIEDGPTKEEFNLAQQSYVNSFVWDFEGSEQILAQLVNYKWRGLPLDTPQRDLAAYQKLTIDDIRRAAKTLLHPDNLVIVVVGDQEKMSRPLSDFGEVTKIELSSN